MMTSHADHLLALLTSDKRIREVNKTSSGAMVNSQDVATHMANSQDVATHMTNVPDSYIIRALFLHTVPKIIRISTLKPERIQPYTLFKVYSIC